MQTQEVAVAPSLRVILKSDSEILDEVTVIAVSYTHLDVYKRQNLLCSVSQYSTNGRFMGTLTLYCNICFPLNAAATNEITSVSYTHLPKYDRWNFTVSLSKKYEIVSEQLLQEVKSKTQIELDVYKRQGSGSSTC